MNQQDGAQTRQREGGRQASAGYGFVQLDRTFHEITSHGPVQDDLDMTDALYGRGSLTWADLNKNYRTVILSEAGSGKTEEIRRTAQRLRHEGHHSFFLRLEHVTTDLNDAFEVGSSDDFDAWLMSEEEGWLFLDSVDEARLKSPGDFATAVRKLGGRIKIATQRTHIVLTGRTHAWRAKSDLELCETHFPYGSPNQIVTSALQHDDEDNEDELRTTTEKNDKPQFVIVALDDLNRTQIEAFAHARGVAETKEFLDGLERADAWSFTTRPQDLQEVIGFWLDKNRIGTRLEIMMASIERRMTERSQEREDAYSLPVDKARQGARLAAAAATLTHNPTIQVPDGAENKNGIPLQQVLSDWDSRERSTLLSYPIFDEAIYATVRFHHRSVREYLTAEWLAELLKRSVSRRDIEMHLFRNQYGVDVVSPTLRPVLPWLALLDAKVRERLRTIAPEILFEGGDPASLPVETRREILGEVCAQIVSDRAGMGATSYAAVQRFANHDIADDIRKHLHDNPLHDELRGFLARMIWLGRLKELLPEASAIALSAAGSKYTRIAGFRAVKELGDKEAAKSLRQHFLGESEELDREWLAELIADTEIMSETVEWFLASVRKAKQKPEFSVDHLAQAAADFIRGAELELIQPLLQGIRVLLEEQPHIERGYCHVSSKNAWLLKAAAAGAEKLISARHPAAFDDVTLQALYDLRISKEWRNELRDDSPKFGELITAWPELNRAAFWHDVRITRSRILNRPNNRLTYFRQAGVFGSFWSFKSDDFAWACDQISAQEEQDDKLVALSLAFDLYRTEGRPRGWRNFLKRAVGDAPELRHHLGMMLRPPKRDDEYRKTEQRWKRQAAARQRRDAENRKKSKEYLTTHIDEIRDPKFPDPEDISRPQWYLHEQIREKAEGLNKWTGGDWRDLIPEFGDEVARAYRDAATNYWRKYKPLLRSDGAQPNSVPHSVIFGLSGIYIEAGETQNWPASLTEEEAALACRYACLELNGFPTWFPNLFSAWPKIASSCLLREIQYELSQETGDQELHYVLSDASWAGQWAWPHLAPDLYNLLEISNPKNSGTLGKLLKILEGSEISDAALVALSSRKVRDPASTNLAMWYATWVGVEPEKAIQCLSEHLKSIADPEVQTRFAMNFVTRLFGSRRSEAPVARAGFQSAEHLKALYLLMHEYIRRSEDVNRAGGGVYSPELRDDAQDARNKLFDALNRLSGKAAFLAMQDIAENHPDSSSKGWLTRLARQKAEQDSDPGPWTPAQVREFNDRLDRTPKNHEELAELATLRLLDLKDDLENGDSSIAAVLQRVESEREMRNFIAHELQNKAFGRYNIPQEDELADAKRPDLRFLGFGFEGAVPAELKLADAGWSGRKLFERLENQLAGDYLRDIKAGRGIFLLVTRGGKQEHWEHPDTGKMLSFEQLVTALRDHWSNITNRFPNVLNVSVIGIDLSKRFEAAV